MNTITSQIKNLSVNGLIPEGKAIRIATELDTERTETIELLKKLERQVGMDMGGRINEHIASMTGTKFNSVEYFYEKPVGEQ